MGVIRKYDVTGMTENDHIRKLTGIYKYSRATKFIERIAYIIENIYSPRPPAYVERTRQNILQMSVIPSSCVNQCNLYQSKVHVYPSPKYANITSKNVKNVCPNIFILYSVFYFVIIFLLYLSFNIFIW